MTFVPLSNFMQIIKRGVNMDASLSFTDSSGTSRTLYSPTSGTSKTETLRTFLNTLPFYAINNLNYTAVTQLRMYATASSDSSISSSAYAPTTTVGTSTCSVTYNASNTGWTMNITVSGTEGDTINSFYFSRKLWTANNAGDYYQAYIFAVKLDNPVTIDSTGTASFTFAIEFD